MSLKLAWAIIIVRPSLKQTEQSHGPRSLDVSVVMLPMP